MQYLINIKLAIVKIYKNFSINYEEFFDFSAGKRYLKKVILYFNYSALFIFLFFRRIIAQEDPS